MNQELCEKWQGVTSMPVCLYIAYLRLVSIVPLSLKMYLSSSLLLALSRESANVQKLFA